MTIVIEPESPSGVKPYEHLKPIVEALIADGNEPSSAHGSIPIDDLEFYKNRDGWICVLSDPINFALIAAIFELPSSIKINEKENTVFCERSWVEICGNVGITVVLR
jgi:hypothetical protein